MDYRQLEAIREAGPWALKESCLEVMVSCPEALRRGRPRSVKGRVSVVPVHGVISQRRDLFMDIFGGTSTDELQAELSALEQDDSVGAVVLDIDSPGGSVAGVSELADQIFAMRDRKPVIAVANSEAASAAYWIGSQASEFIAAPGAQVGSIGVVAMHVDISQALAQEGIKPTLIHAGKHKVDANPYEPLADEAKEHIQSTVDGYYRDFVGAVARGRGTTKARVLSDFGQGKMFRAADAASKGMIDRVATLNETTGRLMKSQTKPNRNAARSALSKLRLTLAKKGASLK